ncbi:MAG: phospho-N-acetylmuramoyl-pentapeptide-transferase [Armatimonadetes bacterium]|nr:phospho-N-acetylmuramoyl-pentapeptide-transferase [Armatimonadota bacterium]MDW8122358.1 phospho-N-acetylmuramoyl-pentapeptide-transferase [Armatimonadota bacterium]
MTKGLLAGIIAFAVTAFVTGLLIPYLKRIRGSSVREDVPERHQQKAGTPTLGGLSFLVSLSLVPLVFAMTFKTLWLAAAVIAFGTLGFVDDWAKLKRQKGLRTPSKLCAQILLTVVLLLMAQVAGWQLEPAGLGTGLLFPTLLILATVNGVNIADGLDGLAAGLVAVASVAAAVSANLRGAAESLIFSLILTGTCGGFLVWNRYPAKVMMGDVGSLALGAGLATAGLLADGGLSLLLAGTVFWIEQATVALQVGYFKWTKKRFGAGRRLFPMTPIHHTFELWGWDEPKIVYLFWLIGILGSLLSITMVAVTV